jgi:predicted transposase YdaD
MSQPRIQEIVRQFPENSLKLLLHHPGNVRDLLALGGAKVLDRIVFDRLTVDPTTYVASDYRHVSSDLVLKVPLRPARGERSRRFLTLYILIEHQSEPDPLMLLRVLDYLVQIWKAQVRVHAQKQPSLADLRLQPILPVVLYTGTRRWEELGHLLDFLEGGEAFRDVTPEFQPLFVSLPTFPAARLESAGGYFGWILELIQQRHTRLEEFQGVLERVVRHLEEMAASERLRWLELLSYIHAFVYHEREAPERPGLQEVITASVRTDEHRQELTIMKQTIADELREEGRLQGDRQATVRTLRQTLLRQLRRRFKRVPKATEQVILATEDVTQLNAWLDQILTAATLAEMNIVASGRPNRAGS